MPHKRGSVRRLRAVAYAVVIGAGVALTPATPATPAAAACYCYHSPSANVRIERAADTTYGLLRISWWSICAPWIRDGIATPA